MQIPREGWREIFQQACSIQYHLSLKYCISLASIRSDLTTNPRLLNLDVIDCHQNQTNVSSPTIFNYLSLKRTGYILEIPTNVTGTAPPPSLIDINDNGIPPPLPNNVYMTQDRTKGERKNYNGVARILLQVMTNEFLILLILTEAQTRCPMSSICPIYMQQ